MRASDKKLNASLRRQIVSTLAQTVADLNNIEDAKTFLNDFFTETELETFSKRLAVSYWLKKGRSYENIKQNLKVSSATIAEISSSSDLKGIKLAMKKIEAEEWANQWADRFKKIVGRKEISTKS